MRIAGMCTGLILGCGGVAFVACHGGSPETGGTEVAPVGEAGSGAFGDAGDGAAPVHTFESPPPSVYVAKVKNILTGLPVTSAEVDAVTADAGALGPLIDTWMSTGEYQAKMRRFFELAFQQTQVTEADYTMLIPDGPGVGVQKQQGYLVQNTEESLARTALALAANGQPLTSAFTTHAFMMTPALMELYAFMDVNQVNDTDTAVDAFAKANPNLSIVLEASGGPIPFADTINPASPSYMHWYFPELSHIGPGSAGGPGCNTDPLSYPAKAYLIYSLLYGTVSREKDSAGDTCQQFTGAATTATQYVESDFTTWKMVTIRQPKPGEATTSFYDLPTLRNATELVLNTPRVGFFTSPAFEANWQTNTSNQMRVTTNQALIVATGSQIDGTDTTAPPSTPGLDAAHAAPGTACYSCHQLLDPTRSILQATYSYGYGIQPTATLAAQPGLFAFQGVISSVKTIDDFAAQLAAHPLVPAAWVQKLCYYANSLPCAADDPEFKRILALWQGSNLSWNVLVKALLSSPITTDAVTTATATEEGEVAPVARRDHLCALLNARLGFQDICGLNSVLAPVSATVQQIATGLPSDAYGRGATTPLLPIQATLFFRSGTENICDAISQLVVDPLRADAGVTGMTFTGASPNAAIASFVSDLMGLTANDPRSGEATKVLADHFQASMGSGATASDALRSTFVLACNSPSVVGMGM